MIASPVAPSAPDRPAASRACDARWHGDAGPAECPECGWLYVRRLNRRSVAGVEDPLDTFRLGVLAQNDVATVLMHRRHQSCCGKCVAEALKPAALVGSSASQLLSGWPRGAALPGWEAESWDAAVAVPAPCFGSRYRHATFQRLIDITNYPAQFSGPAAVAMKRELMMITASDLIDRALLLKHDGLGPREIGRRLVDIAQANGHVRVYQTGSEASPDSVEVKLIDTGVTVYFDGRKWGHTLEGTIIPPTRATDGRRFTA